MMIRLLLLFVTVTAWGQILVEITPIKMKAQRVIASDVTHLSTWTVRACNQSAERLVLDTAWVFIFSPAPVEFISTETGKLLVRGQRKWKPLALAGRGLAAGATIGIGLLAMEAVSASAAVGTALVVGVPIMKKMGEWADEQSQAQEVDLDRVLPNQIALDPLGCITGTAFTNLTANKYFHKYVYEADPKTVRNFLTVKGAAGHYTHKE